MNLKKKEKKRIAKGEKEWSLVWCYLGNVGTGDKTEREVNYKAFLPHHLDCNWPSSGLPKDFVV